MQAFRASALAIGLALPLAAQSLPAQAQVDDSIVLEIMRQCARIDDASARLACYDNNVRSAGAAPARNTVPGQMAAPQAAQGAPTRGSAVRGFGSEDVRTPERFTSEASEITSRVSAVSRQQPGIYRLTLEDGAQWQFAEGVPFSYRPPSAGSTVSIERGSLGSFLLTYDNQAVVPVRRIR